MDYNLGIVDQYKLTMENPKHQANSHFGCRFTFSEKAWHTLAKCVLLLGLVHMNASSSIEFEDSTKYMQDMPNSHDSSN